MKKVSPFSAVLLGGAIGGLLDIVFAISFAMYSGATPERVLQSVASGLLGSSAYGGGMPVALLGLALHFGMSFIWAAAFMVAAMNVPALARNAVVSGIVFGTIVFLVMRLVVLPLSAFPYPVTFKPLATVLDLLSHTLLFGVPIAWAAQKAIRRAAA